MQAMRKCLITEQSYPWGTVIVRVKVNRTGTI